MRVLALAAVTALIGVGCSGALPSPTPVPTPTATPCFRYTVYERHRLAAIDAITRAGTAVTADSAQGSLAIAASEIRALADEGAGIPEVAIHLTRAADAIDKAAAGAGLGLLDQAGNEIGMAFDAITPHLC